MTLFGTNVAIVLTGIGLMMSEPDIAQIAALVAIAFAVLSLKGK